MVDAKYCLGCRDDFYNGKNPLGITECWRRKNARLVWRVAVHVDQGAPQRQKKRRYPDCYAQDNYVFLDPKHPSCQRHG